jgi:2-dehydropantoate 2-reductase
MRVTLIGCGAMGGVFGAALAQGGARIACFDRRLEVVEAIRQQGLRVSGELGNRQVQAEASTEIDELGKADLALVLVDAASTANAAEIAQRCLDPHGYALTLQNGIGNVEALQARLGRDRVAAGITYNSAASLAPGFAQHTNRGPTVVGEVAGAVTPRLRHLAGVFAEGGIDIELTHEVEGHIWSKFVHNCAINPVSALTGLRPGEIWRQEAGRGLLEHLLDEILEVVQRAGISLPERDPRAEILEHCRVRYNRPSMLQHLLAGRSTEIGSLNEALVSRARALGVAVPFNEAVVLLVRALEASGGGRDRELDEAGLEAQARMERVG